MDIPTIENIFLKYRYKFFKKHIKPIDFGTPTWEENWKEPLFDIWNDFFYNGHSYSHPDCVSIENDGLHLKVIPTYENINIWGVDQLCYWKMGIINYKSLFSDTSYGTWSFKVKIPRNSFAALWFLRHSHPPVEMQFDCELDRIEGKNAYLSIIPKKTPNVNWWLLDSDGNILSRIHSYDLEKNVLILHEDVIYNNKHIKIGSDHIIPEVDVMELMKNDKVRHTIHYGFTTEEYRKYGKGIDIEKIYHNQFYEFNVRVLKDKYEFFINGIKTAVFRVGLYDQPLYPILNNAAHNNNFTKSINDFIIESVKFYEHDEYGMKIE